DLTRNLLTPLLDQAAAFLAESLPVTDVAQVLLGPSWGEEQPAGKAAARRVDAEALAEQATEFFARATPLLRPREEPPGSASRPTGSLPHAGAKQPPPREQAFLLIPASEAGKVYGEAVHHVLPQLQVVRVPGQAALMFCREPGWLTIDDLQQLLTPCRQA